MRIKILKQLQSILVYIFSYSLLKNSRLNLQIQLQNPENRFKDCEKEQKLLKIPVYLQADPSNLKYQRPFCQKYHDLSAKYSQQKVSMFKNSKLNIKTGVPTFSCQTCIQQNEPKTEYSVAEKYQIKLVKDMGIKCTFDHSVILRDRLHSYPLGIQLARCDRCSRTSTLSYFRDQVCQVEICFNCVYDMIKDQL